MGYPSERYSTQLWRIHLAGITRHFGFRVAGRPAGEARGVIGVGTNVVAARLALKLSLTTAIFISAASGANSKSVLTVGSGALEMVAALTTNAVKLTVLDDYHAVTNPTGLSLTVTDTNAHAAAPRQYGEVLPTQGRK